MSHDPAHSAAVVFRAPAHLDYSLTGENATRAVERGLAEAEWYQTPVPRAQLRQLLARRDGPAIRDTANLVRPARSLRLGHPGTLGNLVGGPALPGLCGALSRQRRIRVGTRPATAPPSRPTG